MLDFVERDAKKRAVKDSITVAKIAVNKAKQDLESSAATFPVEDLSKNPIAGLKIPLEPEQLRVLDVMLWKESQPISGNKYLICRKCVPIPYIFFFYTVVFCAAATVPQEF